MARFLADTGANPGRGGHGPSIAAGRVVFGARVRLAKLLGLRDPLAVVLTANATTALNLALHGLLRPGDEVVTTVMEHNSVLRPLACLEERGVTVVRLAGDDLGGLGPAELAAALSPRTRLVVLAQASNVTGAVRPLAEIGALTRQRGVLFCVDAAQGAGLLPLDMEAMGIDLLAFTGHKALLGPQGTGGLCLGDRARDLVAPVFQGGTGSASDSDRHPSFLPDRLEAGTLNAVGLAGLAAALDYLETRGLAAICVEEQALTAELLAGLAAIEGTAVLGPVEAAARLGLVSFNLRGWSCSELGEALEEEAGVCGRAGLHCAPLAHRRLGTFPAGALRLSVGPFSTRTDIELVLGILRELARRPRGATP
jgi:cysteine desulfurase family protein